jgi:preprotein translocase subunit SecG
MLIFHFMLYIYTFTQSGRDQSMRTVLSTETREEKVVAELPAVRTTVITTSVEVESGGVEKGPEKVSYLQKANKMLSIRTTILGITIFIVALFIGYMVAKQGTPSKDTHLPEGILPFASPIAPGKSNPDTHIYIHAVPIQKHKHTRVPNHKRVYVSRAQWARMVAKDPYIVVPGSTTYYVRQN